MNALQSMLKNRTTVVLALLLTLAAAAYLAEGLRYPRGTSAQPGPGLFPQLVGVLLLMGALGTLVESIMRPPQEKIWPEGGGAFWRLLAITVAGFGYVLLLPILGHPIAGTLVTLVVLQVMQMHSWPGKILVSLLFGVGSHYLFNVALGVPMPSGLWPW